MTPIEFSEQVYAWAPQGDIRWCAQCNVCHERRLRGCYHEIYYQDEDGSHYWRWACTQCLVEIASEIATRLWDTLHLIERRATKSPAFRHPTKKLVADIIRLVHKADAKCRPVED